MNIKVRNGTPNHEENLCDTCINCVHIQGHAPSQEHRYCEAIHANPIKLDFPVVACTEHCKRTEKSLELMKDIAWIVRTNTTGMAIGFHSPKEFREKNPDASIVPYDQRK